MNFALIGCGNVAKKSVIPAFKKSSYANLVVCIQKDTQKSNIQNAIYDIPLVNSFEEAMQKYEFDAVYIATPTGIHKENILQVAKFKKHILCEKSIVTNYLDAIEIVNNCRENDTALFEGFMYQFHKQHDVVRRIIKRGIIGTPFHFYALFGFPPINHSDFRYRKHMGGGALLDAGAYTIHAARKFFNSEPKQVYSILDFDSKEVEIRGTLMLDFDNSSTAHLAFGFDNFYQNRYEIWGTKGKLLLNRAFSIPSDFASILKVEKQDYSREILLPKCDQFLVEIDYFTMNCENVQIRNNWYNEILSQANVLDKCH